MMAVSFERKNVPQPAIILRTALSGRGEYYEHGVFGEFYSHSGGEKYIGRGPAHASVSYTHLDVYKRQGIHIAASKCPGVHAGVVESVPAALRAITGNGVNVLAMGAFYVAPQMGIDIAEAYLNNDLGSGRCV